MSKSARDMVAMAGVSAYFEYRLIRHLTIEEELLFPACDAVLGAEGSLIELLLSGHRELRAKAAAIKAGAHDRVDSFCVLLERHIRTEERQLFVLAQSRMKPKELEELGRQIKQSLVGRLGLLRPSHAAHEL